MGVPSVDEVVPPEMRTFVNRESKVEVEIAAARARQTGSASSAAPALEFDDSGAVSHEAGDRPAGGGRGGKGGGQKGGGRTRRPPVAPPGA